MRANAHGGNGAERERRVGGERKGEDDTVYNKIIAKNIEHTYTHKVLCLGIRAYS